MPLDVMLEDFDIVIEDDRWEAVDLERLAHAAAQATLGHLGLDAETAEMTLLAGDDARIAVLNEDFRGKARATNVLSWPAEERGAAAPGGDCRAGIPGHNAFHTSPDKRRLCTEQRHSLTLHV